MQREKKKLKNRISLQTICYNINKFFFSSSFYASDFSVDYIFLYKKEKQKEEATNLFSGTATHSAPLFYYC